MGTGELYAETRRRVTELVEGLDATQLDRAVPACPAWTVADLVGHMAGVVADVSAGNLEGAGGDAWSAGQVERARGKAVGDVLAEWAAVAPAVEAKLDQFGFMGKVLLADVTIHEQDIREAVGVPGGTDTAAFDAVVQFLVVGLGKRLEAAGAPALRLVAGDEEWTVGPGEPAATVTADRYELARGLAGRRSRRSMQGWAWDGPAEPFLPHLALFNPPPD